RAQWSLHSLLHLSISTRQCPCSGTLGRVAQRRSGPARLPTRSGSRRGRSSAVAPPRRQETLSYRDHSLQRDRRRDCAAAGDSGGTSAISLPIQSSMSEKASSASPLRQERRPPPSSR